MHCTRGDVSFWHSSVSADEKKRLLQRQWPNTVPYVLEYDMGRIRSVGFNDIVLIAETLAVNGGRTPSRYVSHAARPTPTDPLRQVLTVCHAGLILPELILHGQTLPLIRARHRRPGERETVLDFALLPAPLDVLRKTG